MLSPSRNKLKSSIVALPPTISLITVIVVGGVKVLVTVHVAFCPAVTVIVPSELQSPLNVAA